VQQRIDDGAEQVAVAAREITLADQVDDGAQLVVAVVDLSWLITAARQPSTSSVFKPNRKKFSAPTASRISTLAPSRVPIGERAIHAEFHVAVPEASLPAVEICSDSSAAG